MNIFEIGRICTKKVGREKGKFCVVISKIENNYALIDGAVKRRRCNISHLKPLNQILKIKENANTSTVKDALKKEGIIIKEKIKISDKFKGKKKEKVKEEKKKGKEKIKWIKKKQKKE